MFEVWTTVTYWSWLSRGWNKFKNKYLIQLKKVLKTFKEKNSKNLLKFIGSDKWLYQILYQYQRLHQSILEQMAVAQAQFFIIDNFKKIGKFSKIVGHQKTDERYSMEKN